MKVTMIFIPKYVIISGMTHFNKIKYTNMLKHSPLTQLPPKKKKNHGVIQRILSLTSKYYHLPLGVDEF